MEKIVLRIEQDTTQTIEKISRKKHEKLYLKKIERNVLMTQSR